MKAPPFITRVILKNYKSIAACDVSLGPLTFLVGPNGAGKSNFLDALRFVSDSLRRSLDHALRDRGGIKEVRRRSSGHPTHFGIRLEFHHPKGAIGHYVFRIGARERGGYEVQQEECVVRGTEALTKESFFHVKGGRVLASEEVVPPASRERLYLVAAAGLPPFQPVYDALSRMGFYNLNPARIRDLQQPDEGELLDRDGGNIASVLANIKATAKERKERIERYLSKVVQDVSGVEVKVLASKETLEFRQQVAGAPAPWRFPAASMSDGTLRALGILVALFHAGNEGTPLIPLVGIEEPEVALHPAAAGVLLDALRDASHRAQILVTSHSADLLDNPAIDPESLLAVLADGGMTLIASLDEVGRTTLKDRLFTAGELLRQNQLLPDRREVAKTNEAQLRLFDREIDE